MKTFKVTAERTPDGWWALDSEVGAISQTRRLDQVEEEMREAVAYLAGIDQEEVLIDVQIILSAEQNALVNELESAHVAEARAQDRLRVAAGRAATGLAATGLSRRDIGMVLGVSHQRVSQLASI